MCGEAGHAEEEAIGTSYFCIHPSDFALALSSRLLIPPKDWRRLRLFTSSDDLGSGWAGQMVVAP